MKEASTFGVLVTRLVGNGGAKFETAVQVTITHLYLQFFFSKTGLCSLRLRIYLYSAGEIDSHSMHVVSGSVEKVWNVTGL